MQTRKKQSPTLEEEMALFERGHSFIAGLDEAGRGCLAGPVVAGAVILPLSDNTLELFAGINDSKQLSAAARDRFYDHIMQHALAVGVGVVSVAVIDTRNILQATKYAMELALQQLSPTPDALLLDAIYLPKVALPQRSIIKGDARSLSIAAASIIAKVTRDRLMVELHKEYPHYGFDQHKGYGTAAHVAALHTYGVTPHHRRSFSPISEMFGLFASIDSVDVSTDLSEQ
ncbi:ribonuclease HII [Dictyobacter formicarum]